MTDSIRTTCPYCGVGCGVIATREATGWSIKGDESHPANLGRLCSKGSALGETLDHNGRLLHPMIDDTRVSWDEAIEFVAKGFKQAIEANGPDSVAFYVSGQMLTEDYYVANKLMKGFIGSANIDTNSRLCMSSTVAGYKRAFGSDTVPCSYEDLERAKLIVLVGSNTAWCHPVLFQRIVKAKKDNPDLMVVVIDPRKTASCDIADLHLALQPGSDATLFNGLLSYLNEHDERNEQFVDRCTTGMDEALAAASASAPDLVSVAAVCGLSNDEVQSFYRLFARTERVVTVYSQGINQSSSGTDKVNSIINCHLLTGRIGRPGMGPFSFTGQPNAMGGREVGGLANTLTAHMELGNAAQRQLVQDFWQSPVIAEREGLKAVDLFKAVHSGKIKALWIMCTNPMASVPNNTLLKEALERCELVVVSDAMANTDTAQYANVLLPATTWGEKNGTVTNSERRISRQRRFLTPPGEARDDWRIICDVAKAMGHGEYFDYGSPHEIFKEYAALSGYENQGSRDFDISRLAVLDAAAYDDLQPVQWPVDDDRPNGTKRMFSDGRFFTPDGRARFIPISPRKPKYTPSREFPLVLNTGRSRDQWHTMTRTGKAARLNLHVAEPYLDMHADDIAKYGLSDGGLAIVESRWGKILLRVRESQQQAPGQVFASMHWNHQTCSSGPIEVVVNDAVDSISGQPEFKFTPVRVKPYKLAWFGFLFSRRELNFSGLAYWVKSKRKGFWSYELAGDQKPEDFSLWARQLLCAKQNDVNWVEYLDKAAGRYRGVRFAENTLESCVFISPDDKLPGRDWLAGLFTKSSLTDDERSNLLLGTAPKGQASVGRIICACFSVGENTIKEAIAKDQLTTVEAIGEKLQAGTNCGSCIPELHKLLDQAEG